VSKRLLISNNQPQQQHLPRSVVLATSLPLPLVAVVALAVSDTFHLSLLLLLYPWVGLATWDPPVRSLLPRLANTTSFEAPISTVHRPLLIDASRDYYFFIVRVSLTGSLSSMWHYSDHQVEEASRI
jgi:hypothetical protein